MLISELLSRKGTGVATVLPTAPVTAVLTELAEHGIGALVVSADGERPDGIVSERDIVRALHRLGPGVLHEPVAVIMSRDVHSCTPADTVDSLAATMTALRIRHVPVVADDRLAGIVSIGDVVKSRIDELEEDRRALEHYISAR